MPRRWKRCRTAERAPPSCDRTSSGSASRSTHWSSARLSALRRPRTYASWWARVPWCIPPPASPTSPVVRAVPSSKSTWTPRRSRSWPRRCCVDQPPRSFPSFCVTNELVMTTLDLATLRRDYALATLDERDVDPDPIRQFERWFADASAARVPEPNAMTLSTATRDGVPSARIVLLKGVDANGFVFYTDYRSRKGAELAENPLAALTFLWKEIERQVRIAGAVSRVSTAESEAYFRARPPGSRLSAW